MKRIIGLCLALMLFAAGTAFGFDQAAVDRFIAGDKNMQGADLSGFAFTSFSLTTYNGVDFSGADFSGAILRSREFYDCNLQGADFRGSDLRGAKFRVSNLGRADFSGTLLDRVIVRNCTLQDVKLGGVTMNLTSVYGGDLSGLLDNVTIHAGRLTNVKALNIDWRTVTLEGPVFETMTIEQGNRQYLEAQNVTFKNPQWVEKSGGPVKTAIKPVKPAGVKEYRPQAPAGAGKIVVPKP